MCGELFESTSCFEGSRLDLFSNSSWLFVALKIHRPFKSRMWGKVFESAFCLEGLALPHVELSSPIIHKLKLWRWTRYTNIKCVVKYLNQHFALKAEDSLLQILNGEKQLNCSKCDENFNLSEFKDKPATNHFIVLIVFMFNCESGSRCAKSKYRTYDVTKLCRRQLVLWINTMH